MNITDLIDSVAIHRVNAVAIVAVDKHWGIGIDDQLPKFPKIDLQWFKYNTLNKICIVGSKTFAGLPKLKDRKFIVVTRDIKSWIADPKNKELPNYENLIGKHHSIENAINVAKIQAANDNQTEVMVIGGAEIYNYCFINKLVDEILVTHVWSDQRCNKKIESAAINMNYRGRLISDRSAMADGLNICFYKYKVI